MKIIISLTILFGLLYINFYYADTFVWLFGMLGAMLLDVLIVLFAGSILAKALFD